VGDVYFALQGRKTFQKFKTYEFDPPRKKLFRKLVQLPGCESNNINDEFGALSVI